MEDLHNNNLPEAILTEDINRVRCPYCARIVHVKLGMSGEKNCPYCSQKFIVPETGGEELTDEDFIDLTCPHCGNTVSVDVDVNEHEVMCPFCDGKITY